jgi:hypothetical protein
MSKDFTDMLDSVLSGNRVKVQSLIRDGQATHADENFRFYAAILEWEKDLRENP